MRDLRWQLLIAVGGLILVVGLLIGQTPDLETAPPQPVVGGVYVEALVGEIQRLNPILDIYNQTDRDIDRLIYSSLVRFDEQGMPRPDIADWAVTADATIYTLTLRENAVWHDGEPVTSDDVVYTYSKLQDPDYPGPENLHEFWAQINIIRLDEKSVQFQLPEPFAPFLDYLSVGLLPDHLLRGVSAGDLIDHPYNLQPIGTGPFRFDRFLLDEGQIVGVSLVAFDDYFGQRPFLERVEFRTYPDSAAALEGFHDGEVQGVADIDLDTLPEVLNSIELNLHTARLPQLSIIFLNTKHPEKAFLSDKRLRKALSLSLNRQWIINQALSGQGLIPNGPIMPATWSHAQSLDPIPYDPQGAARTLDSLGWELPLGATIGTPEYVRSKEEQVLSLELIFPDEPTFSVVAEMIKTNWQANGILVTLKAVDPEVLRSDYLEPRAFEAALIEINLMRSPDPDPYPFWHDSQAETGQNYSGFSDRNISIWLEQARITPDFGRRSELYRSFQYRFQDQAPALLLYYTVFNYAIDPEVQGVAIGPLFDPSDRYNNIVAWHLLARRSLSAESIVTATP
ncbi:MAG: hypothetical protein GTO14_18485 [Anaerolineales bacterium]|nr:hypothetical protein [Anaerolineales bacterium]